MARQRAAQPTVSVTCPLDVNGRIVAGWANGDVMRTAPISVQVALYAFRIRAPDRGLIVMAVHPVAASGGNDDRCGPVKRNSCTKGTVQRDGMERYTQAGSRQSRVISSRRSLSGERCCSAGPHNRGAGADGVLLGALGLVLARPLAATAVVLVKMLYVENILGDTLDAPVEAGLTEERQVLRSRYCT